MTTVSAELRKQYLDKMESVLAICRQKNPNHQIPSPRLVFRQMGKRAGLCQYQSLFNVATVFINPDYIKNHESEMLNRTLPHEVAHHVSATLFGRSGMGHGNGWKAVMSWIGVAATRCHTYSTEGVKVRKFEKPFVYSCGCATSHNMTARIHNKIQSGRGKYKCKNCGNRISYSGILAGAVVLSKPVPTPTKQTPFQLAVIRSEIARNEPESKFRTITKFVNGSLTNIRIPVEEAVTA